MFYFCEQHGKGPWDGKFGVINHRIYKASCRRIIDTVADLVEVLTAAHAQQVDIDRTNNARQRPPEHYEEFLPQPKSEVEVSTLLASSLPCTISGCHGWEFTIADRRRVEPGKSLIGKDGRTLTGIKCKASMFWGAQCSSDQTVFPKLRAESDVPEPAEALAAQELPEYDEEYPTTGLKWWQGWRVSFRTQEPDKTADEKYQARVRRKFVQSHFGKGQIPSATSSKTHAEIKIMSDRAAQKRKLKGY